jgi:hypothetical protein
MLSSCTVPMHTGANMTPLATTRQRNAHSIYPGVGHRSILILH